MKRLLINSLLLICAAHFVAGCGDTDRNPLVGEWEGMTRSQFGRVQNNVSFESNGDYFWKYDFPDFDRIVKQNFYLKFALIATEIYGKYRVTDGEMILSPLRRKSTLGGEEKELPPSVTDYEFVYPYSFDGEFLVLIDENGKDIRLARKKGWFRQWFD